MTVQEWLNNNELSITIWEKKYQNNNETFDEWLERVSNGYKPIKELIYNKKFLFGGRILANRGVRNKKTSLSNCYVISPPDDTIESIFDCAKKLARTYSYGGGCGIDLSLLRPNGSTVHNASKTSSGPVSFMDMFSQITQTISQNGRRGALMISMDVNHPDIEEFIDCKTDLNRVNYANISVRISDEFMSAVERGAEKYVLSWPCNQYQTDINTTDWKENELHEVDGVYYKVINPVRLFRKLAENNWNYAEPGILYWNRISNYNLLNTTTAFEYAGVNPCAEEPLPAGGSCLLGSLNLSEFVINPFTNKAYFDFDGLQEATFIAVTALNQVLIEGLTLHPLEEQQNSVRDWRQIGLTY